jgi:acetolactate synthase-1/2/3 large subunit
MMDSIPLVAITGQVRTDLIGDDAFQEAPTTGITRAVTKHNSIVTDIKDLARTIYEAFHIASTGRPGPVLVDVPADLEFQKHSNDGPIRLNLPGYRVPRNGHARQISEAAQAITRAERPVLLAGGGVITANAAQELRDLASTANLPVAMTLMGLGSFDQCRPESLDMPGMHGAPYANLAIQEWDLLVAVGARFDDRVTGKLEAFAPKARVIHVDIDPSNISKTVPADIPIVGDARTVLAALAACVEHRERAPWFAKISGWKRRCPIGYMGMVRQWQELFYRKRYAYSHLRNPDYAEFARAVGAVGLRVQSKDQVGPALERMLREDKPCVVDFHVEAEENVWPMVPAGKSLDEMQGLRELENAM